MVKKVIEKDNGLGKLFETWRKYFSNLEDPRIDRSKRHQLDDILVLTLAAVMAGADDWVSIERFGKAREEWLKQFLKLPEGIPSHDTLGRIFGMLDPEQFESSFAAWTRSLLDEVKGLVAIDGKTVCGSRDVKTSKKAIHLVSAWSEENRLVLGQVRSADHSNEITAIPELLAGLDLSGCIVSIDAMGCQREISRRIMDSDADYILALKRNQGTLHDDVCLYFKDAFKHDFKKIKHEYAQAVSKGHGRVETRCCWTLTDLDWLQKRHAWPGLSTVAVVESERLIAGNIQKERRYYITSLKTGAKELGGLIRSHWGIENRMHWVLDVAFREDHNRTRTGHSAANLSLIRRMALNLLKKDKSKKMGVKPKRMEAAWNPDFLRHLLETF